MVKRLFSFLVACFIVGVLLLPPAVAVGASVLSTVTATFIPPSPSPTPINKTCPVGTPSGWGTYTPSPLWAIECGQCDAVAGTATPTVTPTLWLGTGTPPVGCTPIPAGTGTPSPSCGFAPTATASPSPSPTPSNSCGGSISVTNISLPAINSVTTLISNSLVCEIINGTSVWCHGQIVYRDNHATSDMGWQGVQVSISPLPNTKTVYIRNKNWSAGGLTLSMYSGAHSGSATIGGGTGAGTCDGIGDIGGQDRNNVCGSGSGGITTLILAVVSTGASGNISTNNIDSTFSLSQDLACLVTPMVSPSPSPTPYVNSGYCSSIAPPLDDFSFDLFKNDGAVNCDMGWDGFTVGETEFPSVQICFQPVQFGVIKMFGQEYELGVIALAVATAFIWRFMRTV